MFYIDLLVLPGHCSHLLHHFDITAVSALKTSLKMASLEYEFDFSAIGCTYSQTKKTWPSHINNRHINKRREEIAESFRIECKREPTDKDLYIDIEKMR